MNETTEPAETIMGRLVSLQVGKPKTHDWNDKEWRTAIFKTPTRERLHLDMRNLDGDKQADTRYHGGPDKAVCCFPSAHFSYWQEKLGIGEVFAFGAFGENFTLDGMTEENVCLGDVYAVGSAQVQVSQPRQPCNNLARKWNYTPMVEELIDLGHTGWYLRVLEPGEVGTGDALTLVARPYPDLTIAVLNGAMYRKEGGIELAEHLAGLKELFWGWRQTFYRRLPADAKSRISGKTKGDESAEPV